jgi:hypothetical protein
VEAYFDAEFAEGYILLFLAVAEAAERLVVTNNTLDQNVRTIFRSTYRTL